MKQPENRWGIVVGVDKYPNANGHLADLQGCVVDANKMYTVMTEKDGCGFLPEHVCKLEDATYAKIEEAFRTIGPKMQRGDELWFYYAGHGYSERRRNGSISGYLLPSDVRFNGSGDLSTNGCISFHGLRDDLIARNIDCGQVTIVLFLDCCCAAAIGQMDGTRAVTSRQKEIAKNFRASFRDLNPTVDGDNWDYRYISFMATDQTGKAGEDSSGGVFTKALVKGLKGEGMDGPGAIPSDQYIRAGELGVFLAKQLNDQAIRQDVKEPNFQLSVSQVRKDHLEKLDEKVKQVREFLVRVYTEKLVEREVFCFVENMLRSSVESLDDFPYAGLFRDLMSSLSVNSDHPQTLKNGAELSRAFYELKQLRAQNLQPPKETPVPEISAQVVSNQVPLSAKDKQLLADVQTLLEEADEGIDLNQINPRIEDDPIAWMHGVARERMRKMCKTARFVPLFKAAYCSDWHIRARRGLKTALEGAVFELVKDDEALSMAQKELCGHGQGRKA